MRNQNINKFFTLCFIIIFVGSFISLQANKISLYIIIPTLFLYSFFQDLNLLFKFKPLLIFLILIIWSTITLNASIDFNISLNELKLLTSSFVFSYIIVHFSRKNTRYLYLFHLLYVFSFLSLFYKGYTLGLSTIDVSTERFNSSEINANTFGYFGYFAVISSFFLLKFSFKSFKFTTKNNLYFILSVVVSFLAILASYFAASRGGVTITLLTIFLFLIFTYIFPFSKKTFISLFVFSILLLLFIPVGINYFSDSFLGTRFLATEELELSRFILLKEALDVGLKHPIFGVGPGNFILYGTIRGFSHSTFLETFANNGFIGLFLFVCLFVNYYKLNIKLFILKNINERRIAWFFLVFLLTFAIYNFIYVFHTSLLMMSYFFLLSIHLELYAKSKLIKV